MPWGARRRLAALLVLLVAPLATACENRGSAQPSETEHPEPDPFIYVALGDSYTAAHGVPGTDWLDGCLRSDRNYPHLVAEALPEVTLVDVSCSGTATHTWSTSAPWARSRIRRSSRR